MSEFVLRTSLRRLYASGLREHEIRERLRTSEIWTKREIEHLTQREPAVESQHYINRRKGLHRVPTAQIINNDPVCELVNRYDAG